MKAEFLVLALSRRVDSGQPTHRTALTAPPHSASTLDDALLSPSRLTVADLVKRTMKPPPHPLNRCLTAGAVGVLNL